jgi:hypothetical protein
MKPANMGTNNPTAGLLFQQTLGKRIIRQGAGKVTGKGMKKLLK